MSITAVEVGSLAADAGTVDIAMIARFPDLLTVC
jgi:hypothetical protein